MPANPNHRSSAAHPGLTAGVFGVIVAAVAFLSFADRAPALVRDALRASADAANALQRAVGIDVIDLRSIPYEWELVGHFVLWAAVAVLGRWAFRDRVSLLVLAIVFFVVSYAVEIGQNVLSSSRRMEFSDLVANGLGIAAGLAVAVIAEWAVRLVGNGRSPETAG